MCKAKIISSGGVSHGGQTYMKGDIIEDLPCEIIHSRPDLFEKVTDEKKMEGYSNKKLGTEQKNKKNCEKCPK